MFCITGRFMFSAIAVAILVGGPVTNITNNASEMASVSSCAANLLANQTELIRQLAQEPYDQFVAGLYACSLCNVVTLWYDTFLPMVTSATCILLADLLNALYIHDAIDPC